MIFETIEHYIPHRHGMQLLDKVLHVSLNDVSCMTTVTKDSLFFDAKQLAIPCWVAVEWMAQTVAVFAGYHANKEKPELGFLLSVRKFVSSQAYFALGDTLIINAKKVYLEDSVGVFETDIMIADKLVVSARLNTLQPKPEQLSAIMNRGTSS